MLYNRGEDRPRLRTQEGVTAVEEAIAALQKAEGAPPFVWNESLA